MISVPNFEVESNAPSTLAAERSSVRPAKDLFGTGLIDGTAQTDVETFLSTIHPSGIFEIRSLDCPERRGGAFRSTASGYFSDRAAAAKSVRELERLEPPGIYCTLNAVLPELLARSIDCITHKSKTTASDGDIARRCNLLLDIDADKRSGISATDAESAVAIGKAIVLRDRLRELGWPDPIFGMSGNGASLLYKIDLPVDADSLALIERLYKALNDRFEAGVDVKNANAARITKILGTMARKGGNLRGKEGIEDRPHRRSWYCLPASYELLTREQMEAMAGESQAVSLSVSRGTTDEKDQEAFDNEPWMADAGEEFDLQAWIDEHAVPVKEPKPWNGGQKWEFVELPPLCHGSPSGHTDFPSVIIQLPSGAISAGCQHERCTWTWQDLRKHYEPGAYERQRQQISAEDYQRLYVKQNDDTSDGDSKSRIFRNYRFIGAKCYAPMLLTDLTQDLFCLTNGWPRKVNGTLLFAIENGEPVFLSRSTQLFSWLRSNYIVDWKRGDTLANKDEFFYSVSSYAQAHTSVETSPHFPPIKGAYYTCGNEISAGDGSRLEGLLDFFAPSTPLDRELMRAAIVTLYWGGGAGQRPGFYTTATEGQGCGKSQFFFKLSRLVGGHVEIKTSLAGEKIATALLSPGAAGKRLWFLDNVKTLKLSNADIESLVTTTLISGHAMYSGHSDRPNYTMGAISINAPVFSRDIAQRFVNIELRKPLPDGEWDRRSNDYIDRYRKAIWGDIKTFFQRPRTKLKRCGRWSEWELEVLSRLNNAEAVWELIHCRQTKRDGDRQDAEDIEEHILRALRKELRQPKAPIKIHLGIRRLQRYVAAATDGRYEGAYASQACDRFDGSNLFCCLSKNKCRTYGRGWIFASPGSDDMPVDYRYRDCDT